MVYAFYDSFLKRTRSTLDNPHKNPNYLKCPKCGQPWFTLTRHLIHHHKLSYPDAKKLRNKAKPYMKAQ